MTAVKQVTPEPVLRLLGFKSVSKLLNRHSVRAPYFLQPDEVRCFSCSAVCRSGGDG